MTQFRHTFSLPDTNIHSSINFPNTEAEYISPKICEMFRGKMEIFELQSLDDLFHDLSVLCLDAILSQKVCCFFDNWKNLKFIYSISRIFFVLLCYRLSSSHTELSGSIFQR